MPHRTRRERTNFKCTFSGGADAPGAFASNFQGTRPTTINNGGAVAGYQVTKDV